MVAPQVANVPWRVRLEEGVCPRLAPHLGYVSLEEWELQFADVFDQINAYAAGSPINVVNPDVLETHHHHPSAELSLPRRPSTPVSWALTQGSDASNHHPDGPSRSYTRRSVVSSS